MAEEEEWTTVVSSKSRQKKPNVGGQSGGGGLTNRSNNGNHNHSRQQRGNNNERFHNKNKQQWEMRRDSAPPPVPNVNWKVLKRPPDDKPKINDQSQQANVSRPHVPVSSGPTKMALGVTSNLKHEKNGNLGPGPRKVIPLKVSTSVMAFTDGKTSESRNSTRDSKNLQHFTKPKPSQASKTQVPSIFKDSAQSTTSTDSNNLPSTSQASNPSTEAVPSPKKKKNRNKEERRRKREEKFYQALYQNKDSHIQFVSADVIRQLQGGEQRPSTSKQTKKASDAVAASQSAAPSTQSTDNSSSFLQADFEAFPILTPNAKKNESVPRSFLAIASTPVVTVHRLCSDIVQSGNTENLQPTAPDHLETEAALQGTPKPSNSAKGKKSKAPMTFDLSALIESSKAKGKDKETHGTQKKSSISSTPRRQGLLVKRENHKITSGNPLDSSGPGVIHRGKIKQKKKKPTKLKLTILKSRSLRKMLMEEKVKQDSLQSVIKKEPNDEEQPKLETDEEKVDSLACLLDSINLDAENNPSPESKPELSENEVISTVEQDIKIEAEDEISTTKEHLNNNADSDDMALKFVKLLDEITMLKIAEDKISPEVELAVKNAMHNRKFRDYCDMYTSRELHRLVNNLLCELFRFQDRLYHTDPIKFKTKRRFVSGLKEALSYLTLNKVQLLIIAPDIERNPEPGGLDEKIGQILTLAKGKGVPYVFSGTKYNLGKPMKIKTPISIISVLDKQNCENTFRALMEEAGILREKYHNDFICRAKELVI